MTDTVNCPTIFLVHGTWGDRSPWAFENSDFTRLLNEALGTNARFVRFPWSGNNTHQARLIAGQQLANALRESMQASPHSRHYVVAHSHGGNVALYACQCEDISSALSGIVTMATPFITCEPRRIRLTVIAFLLLMPPLLGGVWLLFVAGAVYVMLVLTVIGGAVALAMALAGAVVGLRSAKRLRPLLRRKPVEEKVRAWQSAILARIRLPNVDLPVLAMRVRSDEARWWLSRLTFASNMPFAVFRAVAWAALSAGASFCVLYVGFILFAATSAAVGGGDDVVEKTGDLIPKGIWTCFALFVLTALVHLAMFFVPRAVRSHRYGFGGERFIDNWLARIGVSAVPECCRHHVAKEYRLRGFTFLAHSQVYGLPDVIRDLATWISERQALFCAAVGNSTADPITHAPHDVLQDREPTGIVTTILTRVYDWVEDFERRRTRA
jgi:pimeloyl-ACP methyl ester carboxylesterase